MTQKELKDTVLNEMALASYLSLLHIWWHPLNDVIAQSKLQKGKSVYEPIKKLSKEAYHKFNFPKFFY